jgi:hypothetical protein
MAKKKKKPSAIDTEKSAYSKLSKQVAADESQEKKTPADSPKEIKLAKQIAKDTKGESALTAAGMGHPDAKALIAAGIPEATVKALTAIHAPDHPANSGYAAATSGSNKGTGVTADPTTPAQYAGDVLTEAGLPDTASNEKLLEDQMTEEGMPGNENNPLATTEKEASSYAVPGNPDDVQDYPTLAEGAEAEAQTLKQSNMAPIYQALLSGKDTPDQYAQGLAKSQYEGSNPQPNEAYAQAFLQDAGVPESQWPSSIQQVEGGGGGGDATAGTDALNAASSTNNFSNLTNLFGTSATPTGNAQSLQDALAGLSAAPSSQDTLTANTSNAPGSPDQTTSASQKTNVNPAALYQAQLAALIPGITPGGKGG